MKHTILSALFLLAATVGARAQSEMYPQHFDMEEVTLLDGPFLTALNTNNRLLLDYDADRLLTPFVRQAGLSDQAGTKYAGWVAKHPSFRNWGDPSWTLEGHVGGHYLTALALAVAATHDEAMRSRLQERLDYMLGVLKDCQDAFDGNTEGLEGFLGGQPFNNIWTGLYAKDVNPFKAKGGMVPFYCEHKVMAGLRDAAVYAHSDLARTLYRRMADWAVALISRLTDDQLQDVLGSEHGGINETVADAYALFGDQKYLDAAKRYSHRHFLDGMQTPDPNFLSGKHANTQVPKYIGFERIHQLAPATTATYARAARNFWRDVAENRTVCIGGNSVSEHFLAHDRGFQYIDNLEGPESCNTNNMLKLSEALFDDSHDARYADFYENATWNHILSTQDPETGGYVYFTSLRPQSYRIYSRVNQGMWCCVGTGMENHSKYGHFIYTHTVAPAADTLFVNLFTASRLESDKYALTQQTLFPYADKTTLTIDRAGTFALALRHPAWAGEAYTVRVNGTPVPLALTAGQASYATVSRAWQKGDQVEVTLPMSVRAEPCPDYEDYVAFKCGPILLAAQTTATTAAADGKDGLGYEQLQNEYGGEGRMDHSPGVMAKSRALSASPMIIGERDKVLDAVRHADGDSPMAHTLDINHGHWTTLRLQPFYTIQHARYSCYFYNRTQAEYDKSDMGRADALEAAILQRTIDFVATGEQQSEAGHQATYTANSSKGSYKGEFYRDAAAGGSFDYILANPAGLTDSVAVLCRFTTADKGRVATLSVDGQVIAEITVPEKYKLADDEGFYNIEYPVPADLLRSADGSAKPEIRVRLAATGATPTPGLYYLRLVRSYVGTAYRFVATDWTTGDASRVLQSNISYDAAANTLTVRATGDNNVCLRLTTDGRYYTVPNAARYLVVKGAGLLMTTGKSYLWWLNGINKGSSVAPATQRRAADGDAVIAWNIRSSALDGNCLDDPFDFTTGQTIFGLTADQSGQAVIRYIGFQTSVTDFLDAVAVRQPLADTAQRQRGTYDLTGRRLRDDATAALPRGVYVVNGAKVSI